MILRPARNDYTAEDEYFRQQGCVVPPRPNIVEIFRNCLYDCRFCFQHAEPSDIDELLILQIKSDGYALSIFLFLFMLTGLIHFMS